MIADFITLLKTMVLPLVMHFNDVSIYVILEEKEKISLQLQVNSEDLGRVIGKDGKNASAIRTILYAKASREGKKIYLDIVPQG